MVPQASTRHSAWETTGNDTPPAGLSFDDFGMFLWIVFGMFWYMNYYCSFFWIIFLENNYCTTLWSSTSFTVEIGTMTREVFFLLHFLVMTKDITSQDKCGLKAVLWEGSRDKDQ